MPLNLSGTLVPFHLLVNPRLVLPSMIVRGQYARDRTLLTRWVETEYSLQEDIRQLDFYELRRAGYRGAVFDKDNCLVSRTYVCVSRSSTNVLADYPT